MTNTKKGFTLIELMVVIVIIGILAAVAIPKLLGMSNKAKAAEAPQILHTYETLQSANLAETSAIADIIDQLGLPNTGTPAAPVWKTNTFTYTEAALTGTIVGSANNIMGDCLIAAGVWQVNISAVGDVTKTLSGTTPVPHPAGATDHCAKLTPNFY